MKITIKKTYLTSIEDNIETNEEMNFTEELKNTYFNNVIIAKSEATSANAHDQNLFNSYLFGIEESILNQVKNNTALEG